MTLTNPQIKMKLLNYIFLFSICFVLFCSCKKDEEEPLIDINVQAEREDQIIQQYLVENNLTAQKTASGIYYIVLQEGQGTLLPSNKSVVVVNYVGTVLYGRQFDSSYEKGEPLTFTVGERMVVAGFDQAAKQMKVGEKTRFFIPSRYAYGATGISSGGREIIHPFAILVFEVKLEQIK